MISKVIQCGIQTNKINYFRRNIYCNHKSYMAKKEDYKLKNEKFLEEIEKKEGIIKHRTGVMYKVIKKGDSDRSPNIRSVVSVHYKGSLINGREFDNSWKRNCPEAFRLSDLVDGWKIALQQMHIGDRFMIYIPYEYGYGTRTVGQIPAYSTLIFEVELLGIA